MNKGEAICKSKVTYKRHDMADGAISFIKKKLDKSQRKYKCRFCGFWHLTKLPRLKKKK